MIKKRKALVLFSGGLDSILVVKLLESLSFSVTGICFSSYFFNCDEAGKSAQENGVKLIKKNFSKKHLGIVKNPKYGSGGGLNPCIDCHGLMLKEAHKVFREGNFDILATGEVLGQRPFSQHKQAFINIEKLTGLECAILRPLSGQLLPETIYEKRGLINKKNLKSIQGRNRKEQMRLVKKFNIKKYPNPAGGCILTEKEYCQKLRKLFKFKKNLDKQDFELIKMGRHFWLNSTHVVLGKNKEQNEILEKLKDKEAGIVMMPNYAKGPTAFIESIDKKAEDKTIDKVKKLIWKYSNDPLVKKFNRDNYLEA